MIGQISGWYIAGRRDAMAGVYTPGPLPSPRAREIYSLGYSDELARMKESGRLAQGRLEL